VSKKIPYNLCYREEGEDKTIKLEIDFVSKRNFDEFNEIRNEITRITSNFFQYKNIIEKVEELRLKRPDNYKTEIEKLNRESEKFNIEATKFNEQEYNQKRWGLLQRVLIDNKIKPIQAEYDIVKKELNEAIKSGNYNQKKQKEQALKNLEEREKLFTVTFWEENVETSTLMDFLETIIYKDINDAINKKKVMQ
jgi:hypothetical protein